MTGLPIPFFLPLNGEVVAFFVAAGVGLGELLRLGEGLVVDGLVVGLAEDGDAACGEWFASGEQAEIRIATRSREVDFAAPDTARRAVKRVRALEPGMAAG